MISSFPPGNLHAHNISTRQPSRHDDRVFRRDSDKFSLRQPRSFRPVSTHRVKHPGRSRSK
ncbi:hypothetical protein B0H12DRAFT_1106096 [Mycena haematopus]|nr:hypothetical protein B0H12DRAFT_1106096 [Mycena haematopus]